MGFKIEFTKPALKDFDHLSLKAKMLVSLLLDGLKDEPLGSFFRISG